VMEVDETQIREAVEQLNLFYGEISFPFRIQEVAGALQAITLPEYRQLLERFHQLERRIKLSPAAIETLAIVAYKQPVTRIEIDHIRGVNSSGILRSLLEKRMVRITGRSSELGKPLLYATTKEFLIYFGLPSLTNLPNLEEIAEINTDETRTILETNSN